MTALKGPELSKFGPLAKAKLLDQTTKYILNTRLKTIINRLLYVDTICMKSQNFKKFFNDDTITIYVCVFGLLIGWYALHSDFSFFNIGGFSGSGQMIGTVDEVESDVRLRTIKNIFWQNARTLDSITEGDSLFVGPDSSIIVRFEDGKSVTIGANSLIKFKTEKNKIKLNLKYGSIKSKNLPSQLILDDCGETLDIKAQNNADLEIGKTSECGKIKVKAKNGEVKVNDQIVDKTGLIVDPKFKLSEKPLVNEAIVNLESLAAAELANLKGIKPVEEAPKKVEVAVEQKPLLPPQLLRKTARILINKEKSAAASWQKAEMAEEYILETSAEPEFKNPTIVRTPASIHPVKSSDNDQLYYRLKSVDKDKKESEYSEIGQIDFIYPSIKIKEPKTVYDYVAKNSKDLGEPKDFNVQWTEIPNAAKYIVEVDAKDGDFSEAKKYTVRQPAGAVKIPGQGEYQYRVSAYNAKNRKISSSSNMGEIIYNRFFDMKTPSIEKTASSLQFFFQKGLGKYIWLKWTSPEAKKTDKYRVEVAQDQNFTQLFKSYSTPKTKVLIQDNLPPGNYFWRVRAESTEGTTAQVSDWSNPGQLEIKSGAK